MKDFSHRVPVLVDRDQAVDRGPVLLLARHHPVEVTVLRLLHHHLLLRPALSQVKVWLEAAAVSANRLVIVRRVATVTPSLRRQRTTVAKAKRHRLRRRGIERRP